jgi:sugar lactone lactonase YvrE
MRQSLIAFVLLVISDPSSAIRISPGDVILYNHGCQAIPCPTLVALDRRTGRQQAIGAIVPTDVVAAPDSRLFVLTIGDTETLLPPGIWHIDPVTLDQTVVSVGGLISTPQALALGPNGNLFVLDSTAKSIIGINPATGAQEIAFENATGDTLAVAPDGVFLTCQCRGSLGSPSFSRLDPVSKEEWVFSVHPYWIRDLIAVADDTAMVLADDGVLETINSVTGERLEVLLEHPLLLDGDRLAIGDGIFVTMSSWDQPSDVMLLRFDMSSKAVTSLTAGDLQMLPSDRTNNDVAAIAGNQIIVVAGDGMSGGSGGSALYYIDFAKGTKRLLFSNLVRNKAFRSGIGRLSSLTGGNILITQESDLEGPGGVFMLDPRSGARHLLARAGEDVLLNPKSAFLDELRSILFVVDGDRQALIRMELDSGQEAVIASLEGMFLEDTFPFGGELTPDGEALLLVAEGETGEWFILEISNLRADAAEVSILSKNTHLAFPRDLASGPGHGVFVADQGQVVKVNRTDGSQQLVSTDALLLHPSGIQFDTTTGGLLVADRLANAIYQVDPYDGGVSLLADSPLIQSVADLAIVVPEPGTTMGLAATLATVAMVAFVTGFGRGRRN